MLVSGLVAVLSSVNKLELSCNVTPFGGRQGKAGGNLEILIGNKKYKNLMAHVNLQELW